LGGYDKGVVVEGVARAVKKAASSSSLLPSSESPPGGRGNRGSNRGAILRVGGGRGGRRSPVVAMDADARHSDSNGPSSLSSCQGWRGGSREGYSFSAINAARKRKKR
jgi:hypothetical protein